MGSLEPAGVVVAEDSSPVASLLSCETESWNSCTMGRSIGSLARGMSRVTDADRSFRSAATASGTMDVSGLAGCARSDRFICERRDRIREASSTARAWSSAMERRADSCGWTVTKTAPSAPSRPSRTTANALTSRARVLRDLSGGLHAPRFMPRETEEGGRSFPFPIGDLVRCPRHGDALSGATRSTLGSSAPRIPRPSSGTGGGGESWHDASVGLAECPPSTTVGIERWGMVPGKVPTRAGAPPAYGG